MNRTGTWGSDIEMITAFHVAHHSVCMTQNGTWSTYGP